MVSADEICWKFVALAEINELFNPLALCRSWTANTQSRVYFLY